jgi:single-stranded-DNA-specific exonuclease
VDLKWVVQPETDHNIARKLSDELDISHIASRILVSRGLKETEQAKKFLKPTLSDLFDPFLMSQLWIA